MGMWGAIFTTAAAIAVNVIPGIGQLASIAIVTASAAAGSYIDSLVAPTGRRNEPDFDSSPTFGFGVRNTIDPDTRVAMRYGEHLAQAHVIAAHITQEDRRTQAISVLTGWSEGEIESYEDVRADGSSIWDTIEGHPCSKKGNGTRYLFDIEHESIYEPSLVVYVDGVEKTLTTDYTVGGTFEEPTIQFKHDAIPANNEKVTYDVKWSPMGIRVTERFGTSDQALIDGFQELAQTHTIQKTITKAGGGYTYRTSRKVEDLVVHILCPYGLIHHHKGKDAGKTSEISTAWNIEVRTVDDDGSTVGEWVRILGNKKRKVDGKKVYTGEFGISAETTSALRKAIRLTDYTYNEKRDKFPGWTTATRVDVRVTKTAKDFTSDDQAGRLINDIALEHVTEITYDAMTYPYTAVLGLEGIANDQLSGAFPEITVVGKWRKTADLGASTAAAWDNSYPWAICDVLTAYSGLGQWFTSSAIDTSSFDTWASFCEETVTNPDSTKEARYRFDGAVDAGEMSIDVLRRIATQGQAFLVWYEGTWSAVVDTSTAAVSFSFTDGSDGEDANLVADSVRFATPTDDPPNVLVGQFQNRTNDWEPDTLTIEDRDSLAAGDPVVSRTVSLYGVTRPTQVARTLDYYLKSIKYAPGEAQWAARAVSTKIVPGDVVPLTYDPMGWSAKKFRVTGIEWMPDLTVRFTGREYDERVYGAMKTTVRPPTTSTMKPSTPATSSVLTSIVKSVASYPTKAVSLTLTEVDD